MPIVTLQRAARELGRIRLGEYDPGRGAPAKLDRFRLTSPSEPLLRQVAARYGGEVRAWTPQGGGPAQHEVYTEATRIPVLVPPNPLSQWFELWSGGGCQRRCDGNAELIGDSPCLCDPENRACQPTTRLNVVLREVPGLGVWRLETHGYYAAVELPSVAEFLALTDGYVRAVLTLTERTVKRIVKDKPKTLRFVVPAIEVEDVTPDQLMTGTGAGALRLPAPAGRAPAAAPLSAPYARPALERLPSVELPDPPVDDPQVWVDTAQGAGSVEMLSALLRDAQAAGHARDMTRTGDPVVASFLAARQRLTGQVGATPGAAEAEAESEQPVDLAELWTKVLMRAPEDWSTDEVQADFELFTGAPLSAATPANMARYLARRKVATA